MTYEETTELLFGMFADYQKVGAGAYKPGLDNIRSFLRHLGSPEKSFCTIHIAGTNGKGSVSHAIASVLQAAGYRTGLYTSPHITDFRERIRVDGQMIPKHRVADFTARHLPAMERLGLSFFEVMVGMAFDHFAASDVEVAVVETGLGGRLDATNVIKPELSVITNIDLDHTSTLGNTRPEIAAEKAGIIKRGVPVLLGTTDEETLPVFRSKAERERAGLFLAPKLFSVTAKDLAPGSKKYRIEPADGRPAFEIATDLSGDYQIDNIRTAVAALWLLNRYSPLSISHRAVKCGLENVREATGLRGRWEVLGREPLIVCDTAHNAHGIRSVAGQIVRQKYDRLYVVLGVVDDKDLGSILPLLPVNARYLFTRPSNSRGLDPGLLAEAAAAHGLTGDIYPTVPEAYAAAREAAAPGDMIFVGGSTFTVADIPDL